MPDYFGVQDDHYHTMDMDAICAMPIKNVSEDNSVMFLWATSPILEEAFQVIRAWGFEYKTSFVWDKVKHVMGHYNSVRHELLLVCVRGSCQPDERKLFDSVYTEERTEHSKKPEYFRKVIDTIYPIGKRIELFAREQHEGWTSYGNEIS
jgi:N6-adenosine-specific RNA methylase IME4